MSVHRALLTRVGLSAGCEGQENPIPAHSVLLVPLRSVTESISATCTNYFGKSLVSFFLALASPLFRQHFNTFYHTLFSLSLEVGKTLGGKKPHRNNPEEMNASLKIGEQKQTGVMFSLIRI